MAVGRIHKRSVDAFLPAANVRFLWDDELKGFGRRLSPSGARSYVLQYRMGGREAPTRRYTIGRHGSPWTPDQARDEAKRLLYLVHVLLLTAQRREEVARMDWSELNRPEKTWILPQARTKNGKPHLVPLSAAAIEVLDQRAGGETWPTRGLVFSTTGKTPVSGFTKPKRRLDEFVQREFPHALPWRVHDLRRTVATGLQRLNVRFEVTEAVLNHVSGSRSGIAGVYQRFEWA